jgi:predicted DNA-binding WGR domain protein
MFIKKIAYRVKTDTFEFEAEGELQAGDDWAEQVYRLRLWVEKRAEEIRSVEPTQEKPRIEVKTLRQANRRTISDPTPVITKKEKKFQEDMGLIPPASIAGASPADDLPAQPRSKRLNAMQDKPPEPESGSWEGSVLENQKKILSAMQAKDDPQDYIARGEEYLRQTDQNPDKDWPPGEKLPKLDPYGVTIVGTPLTKENTFRGISDFMVTPDQGWMDEFADAKQASEKGWTEAAQMMGNAMNEMAQSWGQVGEAIQQQFINAFASNPALSDLLASMQSGKVLKKSVVDSYSPDPFALARLTGNTNQLPPEQEANRPREPPGVITFTQAETKLLRDLGYTRMFMPVGEQIAKPKTIDWADASKRSYPLPDMFTLGFTQVVALQKVLSLNQYDNTKYRGPGPAGTFGWVLIKGMNLKAICDEFLIPQEKPEPIIFYVPLINVLLKLGYDRIWFLRTIDPNVKEEKFVQIDNLSLQLKNPFKAMPNEQIALRKAKYREDPKMKWGWIVNSAKDLKKVCDAYIELDQ